MRLSIEHKIKNELAIQFDFEPEDIKDHTPLKTIVLAIWSMQIDEDDPDFDRFDGLYYESEYYVQHLIRQIGYRLNLEFDLESESATISAERLIKIARSMKHVD